MGLQDIASRPWLPVLGTIVVVVGLVAGGNLLFGSGAPAPVAVPQPVAAATSGTAGPDVVVVHVSGAVRSPGLVTVAVGSRVAAAIAAAGGARRDATLDRMNLASVVDDGAQVHVPAVDETDGGASPADGPPGVDLNAATAEELEALPGVGPVLAARIVAHRDAEGFFQSIEDLLDVSGIGEAKLAQLRTAVRAP